MSSFPHRRHRCGGHEDALTIKGSNPVFCRALFGHEKPDRMSINSLVLYFDKVLGILTEEDGLRLVDGIVVPEHSFGKAAAFLALKGESTQRGDKLLATGRSFRLGTGMDLNYESTCRWGW